MSVLILVLVNFIAYARTFKYDYVSDDIPVYHRKPKFKNWFDKRYQQLIGTAKISPKQDHIITFIIHTLVCIFIYLALGKNDISFLTALLFSINPVNNQGSVWISGRGYSLPSLLLLMAITSVPLSPVFLYASTFHTAGFLAPIALLGSKSWWMICFMPVIWVFHFKGFKKTIDERTKNETFTEDKRFHIGKIVLAFKTYGYYLVLCLFPYRLSWHHEFLQSAAGNSIMRKRAYSLDRHFFVGITFAIGILTYSIINWTPVSWGCYWFTICILPYLNLRRLNQEIAERYCYMANIGLMFALSNVIISYPVAQAVFLTLYFTRLQYYLPAYTDDYWLIEYATLESPKSWFAWHMRGIKRLDQHSIREALNMFVMAKMLSPKEFKVLYNIGTILKAIGKKDESKEFFAEARKNIVEGQEDIANEVLENAEKGKPDILT